MVRTNERMSADTRCRLVVLVAMTVSQHSQCWMRLTGDAGTCWALRFGFGFGFGLNLGHAGVARLAGLRSKPAAPDQTFQKITATPRAVSTTAAVHISRGVMEARAA